MAGFIEAIAHIVGTRSLKKEIGKSGVKQERRTHVVYGRNLETGREGFFRTGRNLMSLRDIPTVTTQEIQESGIDLDNPDVDMDHRFSRARRNSSRAWVSISRAIRQRGGTKDPKSLEGGWGSQQEQNRVEQIRDSRQQNSIGPNLTPPVEDENGMLW